MRTQDTPSYLRLETRRWFATVASEYVLEEHHLKLLELAAAAWDRMQEAREAIDEKGAVFINRFDEPRPRPEVKIEKDAATAYARFLRELALDVDPPQEAPRIPRGAAYQTR